MHFLLIDHSIYWLPTQVYIWIPILIIWIPILITLVYIWIPTFGFLVGFWGFRVWFLHNNTQEMETLLICFQEIENSLGLNFLHHCCFFFNLFSIAKKTKMKQKKGKSSQHQESWYDSQEIEKKISLNLVQKLLCWYCLHFASSLDFPSLFFFFLCRRVWFLVLLGVITSDLYFWETEYRW